jgi:nicotinate-nucleotide--dimethylbenzimidazole phosphoribosyltransferase
VSEILRHVIESISPASRAHGEAAAAAVAPAGAPVLERLARSLGGAQHVPKPRAARRAIVVAIGDHGCGDPGIAMGADHPTVVAARAIADGTAALVHVARSSQTPILLVDAGAREPAFLPTDAIRLGRGPTRDLAREPAMTVVDAVLGLEAGIALAVSITEPGPEAKAPGFTLGAGIDVIALGALGLGSEVAAAALYAAATGLVPDGLDDPGAAQAAARAATAKREPALDRLATYGGAETCVLAGLILGAASVNVPVVLDGHATGAAALAAVLLAPAAAGYLIAAHRGGLAQPAILVHLGLAPIFEIGLGHGDGTGAAMLLPLIDQVAAIAAR